ncbi:hypothetical protein EDD92_8197 [Streptomyces sp. TLI_185]|nr:hypothetical protein EDD92_8197 [Streptomyces sp. TLI_185]
MLSYVPQSLRAIPPSLPAWLYPAARAAPVIPAVRRHVPRLRTPGPAGGHALPGTAYSGIGRILASGHLVPLDNSHDANARLMLLLFPRGFGTADTGREGAYRAGPRAWHHP